mmetsp:Transcript_32832/g.97820  ORF Transcript_32832/g.97820 Transcript_32832/m.97820 type:complete len:417 (-) Transcript_32832:457-1707(-)
MQAVGRTAPRAVWGTDRQAAPLRPLTGRLYSRSLTHVAAKRTKKTPLLDYGSVASPIDDIVDAINARFGKGTITRLEGTSFSAVPMTPSGVLSLDAALGGGYPVGRIVEIFGPESSGKTTLALHAIAEVQKAGRTAVFIDAEHALDKKYAQAVGVDTASLLLVQPDSGEEALEIADQLARSGEIGMVVVDSVSALVPRAELEGEIGTITVGAQARLMSSAMRKLCGSVNKGNTTLLFLNQIRMKVGVVYGNPEITSGGNALKYYSSVRVDVRKKDAIKGDKDEVVGAKVRVKIVKNKVGVPYREAMFDVRFGMGIDELGSVFEAAELVDVIERKGSWYFFGDEKLAQGRENALLRVREDAELQSRLRQAVKDNFRTAGVSGDGDAALMDDDPEGQLGPFDEGTEFALAEPEVAVPL